MSRKITPVLVALALVLGTAAFLTRQKQLGGAGAAGPSGGARVLTVATSDVREVRVQRDFWNTFVLRRQQDGLWRLTEPMNEEAAPQVARKLVEQLADLPALDTIDLPSDDSERYREYGLWRPELEVAVTTADQRHVLLVGSQTLDGASYYATLVGSDEVHTIPAAAVEVLGAELASYRAEAQPAETGGTDG